MIHLMGYTSGDSRLFSVCMYVCVRRKGSRIRTSLSQRSLSVQSASSIRVTGPATVAKFRTLPPVLIFLAILACHHGKHRVLQILYRTSKHALALPPESIFTDSIAQNDAVVPHYGIWRQHGETHRGKPSVLMKNNCREMEQAFKHCSAASREGDTADIRGHAAPAINHRLACQFRIAHRCCIRTRRAKSRMKRRWKRPYMHRLRLQQPQVRKPSRDRRHGHPY
jgi:hypothetical protein